MRLKVMVTMLIMVDVGFKVAGENDIEEVLNYVCQSR